MVLDGGQGGRVHLIQDVVHQIGEGGRELLHGIGCHAGQTEGTLDLQGLPQSRVPKVVEGRLLERSCPTLGLMSPDGWIQGRVNGIQLSAQEVLQGRVVIPVQGVAED